MKYGITTVRALRAAFWNMHPEASRKKVPDDEGSGTMYVADTRLAFIAWIDSLACDGVISEKLAKRATL